MSHDDLTDDTPTTTPWTWIVWACLLAAVAFVATDGGKGSMPEPLSPPCSPSAAETVSGAPEPPPSVEPRTPENCEEGP